jgi:hypothetical protein
MCDTLEDAHKHSNTHVEDLLQVLHRLVTRCHRAPKKTDLQKSIIERWRAPAWAKALRYDPHTEIIISTSMTKGELNNQRATSGKKLSARSIGSTEHTWLQLELAHRLNLIVNGWPHLHLGNLSSPQHEDHPTLWQLWTRLVCTHTPKGLGLGPEGVAYKQAIQGFWVLAPMCKDGGNKKNKDDVQKSC